MIKNIGKIKLYTLGLTGGCIITVDVPIIGVLFIDLSIEANCGL